MSRRITRAVALGLSALLIFSACFGGEAKESSSAAPVGQTIRISGFEPNSPVLPGAVMDEGGVFLLRSISAGLVTVDRDGMIIMEIAESIETEDNINWTVKLKKDWKFSNGEPVSARSFVDAWNYIAKARNAQPNRYYLENIDGYAEDGYADLSGLNIVSYYTFTIRLKTPVYQFLDHLDAVAFLPLPSAAFRDMEVYGEYPVIGNGPYILEDRKSNIGYKLKRNPDYKGYWQVAHPALEVNIYEDGQAAYADYLAGKLDLINAPSEALKTFEKDSQGRYLIVEKSEQELLSISGNTPGFGFDEAGRLRRQAISMAINREQIAGKAFKGLRKPANTFLPPNVAPGYGNLEGIDTLKFNPQKAKELWVRAEAIAPYPKNKRLKLPYNIDDGDKDWVEAVAHQLRENLGLDNIEPVEMLTFAEYVQFTSSEDYQGFKHLNWFYNHGLAESFFSLYHSDGEVNQTGYSNAEVDRLIEEGTRVHPYQASAVWRKLQEELLQDLPMIPLFNYTNTYLYGKGVTGLEMNLLGEAMTNRLFRE